MHWGVLVVDTNVVVAGMLISDAASPVARVLDGMVAATFPVALSEALLGEYRTVLSRPSLRRLYALAVAEVEQLLVELVQHAIPIAPATAPPAPDPGDPLLWNLLAARPDLVLATGDRRLRRDAGMRGRVLSPRAWVDGR